jgi:pyruvate, water dikinase
VGAGGRAGAGQSARCWGSLYSVESITYRRKHGLPEDGVAMAVVVQRMVDARAPG